MKKVLSFLLFLGILAGFTTQVSAEEPTVGVNIEGEVSIDAVATIKADVTVNITDKKTSSTYLYLENNQTIPTKASITNIKSLTGGAPSTFIPETENWNTRNYGATDTATKIGFNIDNHTASFTSKNIQPNQSIDLGVIGLGAGMGDVEDTTLTFTNQEEITFNTYTSYMGDGTQYSIFEITPYVGYSWTNTNQQFQYAITVVFELSEESMDGKSWKNEDATLGLKNVFYTIGTSNTKDYLVGAVVYDKTVAGTNGINLNLPSYQELTIVSDSGKHYPVTISSTFSTAKEEFGNTVTSYVASEIDLSALTETGYYYLGIPGIITKDANSKSTGQTIKFYYNAN